MSDGVIIAVITGFFSLLGVIVTVAVGNRKTREEIKQHNELTLYRIQELERKQDKHNSVIERTYALEKEVAVIKGHLDEMQRNDT